MQLSNNQKIFFEHPSTFIVSSGRSGTTLLVALLNATEQINIPYESDFIARAYSYYENKQFFQDEDYQKIARLFQITSQPKGWGMSEKYLLSCLKEQNPQTFSEVNTAIYTAFQKKQGNTGEKKYGIKSPVLISSLEEIGNVYPKAKIIHVVRDGRDVCLSYRKIHQKSKIKFGPKGIVSSALYWIDGLRRIEEAKQTEIYQLRYEDLIEKTEQELMNICAFLDLEYKLEIYNNYLKQAQNQEIVPQKLQQIVHKKIGKQIDSQNSQKFLNQMNQVEKFVFELIAIPYLKKYNYICNYGWLNRKIFTPIRYFLYFTARKLNTFRYARRNAKFFKEAQI